MKQRITYIDELKGFAILTVVIGHVFYFCFRAEGVEYNSPWSELLYSFHMPLFAFLSGLFIKPWANWKALCKSLERLGMPLLVMGGLYTLWRGFSLQDFIHSEFKYGYWYFLFLFLAYLIVTLYGWCEKRINRKQRASVDFLLMTLACVGIWGGVKYVSPTVYDTIGCSHLSSYMKFVFAGWFISRHGLFEKAFSCRICFEACCMLAFAAYIVRHYLHHGTALYLVQPCLVYVIVTLFYRMKDRTNRAKNTLQQWGKNSLEIYSLHYFFIRTCSLPVVYAFTEGQNLEFVEIILAGVIAVVMCLVCVWWGRLINMSGVFGYLCFGNRTKQ